MYFTAEIYCVGIREVLITVVKNKISIKLVRILKGSKTSKTVCFMESLVIPEKKKKKKGKSLH